MRTVTYITLTLALIMTLKAKLMVIDLDNREDMRQLTSLIGEGKFSFVFEMGG